MTRGRRSGDESFADPRFADERWADWVDGRLDAAERAQLEAELAADPRLRAAAEDYRRLVIAVRVAMRSDSVAALAAAEDDEGAARVDRIMAAVADDPAPIRWRAHRFAPWLGSLAAALLLLATFAVVRGVGLESGAGVSVGERVVQADDPATRGSEPGRWAMKDGVAKSSTEFGEADLLGPADGRSQQFDIGATPPTGAPRGEDLGRLHVADESGSKESGAEKPDGEKAGLGANLRYATPEAPGATTAKSDRGGQVARVRGSSPVPGSPPDSGLTAGQLRDFEPPAVQEAEQLQIEQVEELARSPKAAERGLGRQLREPPQEAGTLFLSRDQDNDALRRTLTAPDAPAGDVGPRFDGVVFVFELPASAFAGATDRAAPSTPGPAGRGLPNAEARRAAPSTDRKLGAATPTLGRGAPGGGGGGGTQVGSGADAAVRSFLADAVDPPRQVALQSAGVSAATSPVSDPVPVIPELVDSAKQNGVVARPKLREAVAAALAPELEVAADLMAMGSVNDADDEREATVQDDLSMAQRQAGESTAQYRALPDDRAYRIEGDVAQLGQVLDRIRALVAERGGRLRIESLARVDAGPADGSQGGYVRDDDDRSALDARRTRELVLGEWSESESTDLASAAAPPRTGVWLVVRLR